MECPLPAEGQAISTGVRTSLYFSHLFVVRDYRIYFPTAIKVGQQPPPRDPMNGTGYYDVVRRTFHPIGVGQGRIDGDLMSLATSEWFADEDLDGDGVKDDYVLQYWRESTEEVVNTAQVLSEVIAIDDPVIAYRLSEKDAGEDLSGDGDLRDSEIRYWDTSAASVVSTGLFISGSRPLDAGQRVVFSVSESSAGGGVDLNGDGDAIDSVLHVLDLASGEIENLGLAGAPTATDGRWVALAIDERAEGRDLNGDGDRSDAVLHILDTSTMSVSNRALALGRGGSKLAAGRLFFLLDDGALVRYEIEAGSLHPVLTAGVRSLEALDELAETLVYTVADDGRRSVWYYEVEPDQHVFLGVFHGPTIRGERIAWHDDSGVPDCGARLPWIHFHDVSEQATYSTGMIGDLYTQPAQGPRLIAINANEYANQEDLDGNGSIEDVAVLQYFLFPCRSFDDLRETLAASGFDDLRFDPPLEQRIDAAEAAADAGDQPTASRILSAMMRALHYADAGTNGAVATVGQCVEDLSPPVSAGRRHR